ncbi:MAG TPA: Hsp20/alpha crystallin family protein [Actinomycetales bacterium]|nr:Hsp20/alpha crystallin family protein [Actinomycetales bacterium]
MANRYDPFAELSALMNSTLRQSTPAMPMDLYRVGDVYTAKLDLPGVEPGSIDIDVEDRTLTIRAERPGVDEEGIEWISKERGSGTYARQMTLGYGLDLTKVEATYTDGVLTLTIPVAEEAKPRKIQVNTSGTSTPIES